MSEYEEDIAEAIRVILGTTQGERVMRPGFGCDVQGFNFELTDDTTLHLLQSNIQEAIRNWEPRVHEVDVKAIPDTDDPARVRIHISYLVRTTNNLFNQVYPFYLFEGSK